ncbi:MAG TPA: hypothetical protein DD376_05140 [Sutterella sp.]|nr:hypothetical protein [Sutterella sp.]
MTQKFSSPSTFDELLSGTADSMGLLKDVQPAARKAKPLSIVDKNFMEIVDFYKTEKRIPSVDAEDFREKTLAARLAAYRSRAELKAQVKQLDSFGLLDTVIKERVPEQKPKNFSSFEELLKSDSCRLFGEIDSSIFDLKHIQSLRERLRNLPEEIASRKQCQDFFRFEKLFQDIQQDILNGKAKTARFKNETQVEIGDFFILNGLLCLVDDIIEESGEQYTRDNPRLRVIFENGVETNILKRSLSRALYKDANGRRVIPTAETVTNRMVGLSHRDKATGCIYILASETKAPELAELKRQGRLVKIGYSSQSVEERVKHAADDPTYLEAPVRILASLDCFNLNPQKVEHLIHAFLVKQRINMTIISSKGIPYKPTEWFAVDRDTAIEVAEHIVKGDIMKYRMDNTTGKIKLC